MFSKIVENVRAFLFGRVILKKVAGKFAKHTTGALVALLAAKPVIVEAGVTVDFARMETWLAGVLAGLFGAAWNFVEHRFVKK